MKEAYTSELASIRENVCALPSKCTTFLIKILNPKPLIISHLDVKTGGFSR
jgi:hypothetical protein